MPNPYRRPDRKLTVEDFHRLQLKDLDKDEVIEHRDTVGFIVVLVHSLYKEGLKHKVTLPLASKKTYQGHRTLIRCPHCDRQCLYLLYREFERSNNEYGYIASCRKCLNVNYKSEQTTKGSYQYHTNKMEKIARKIDPDFELDRLSLDTPFPERPYKSSHMKYIDLRIEYNHHLKKAVAQFRAMITVDLNN